MQINDTQLEGTKYGTNTVQIKATGRLPPVAPSYVNLFPIYRLILSTSGLKVTLEYWSYIINSHNKDYVKLTHIIFLFNELRVI